MYRCTRLYDGCIRERIILITRLRFPHPIITPDLGEPSSTGQLGFYLHVPWFKIDASLKSKPVKRYYGTAINGR